MPDLALSIIVYVSVHRSFGVVVLDREIRKFQLITLYIFQQAGYRSGCCKSEFIAYVSVRNHNNLITRSHEMFFK